MILRSNSLKLVPVNSSGSPAKVAISSDCSPMSVKTTSGEPSPLTSPAARSASRASVRLDSYVAIDFSRWPCRPGLEHAEPVGPGDQKVVAPVRSRSATCMPAKLMEPTASVPLGR